MELLQTILATIVTLGLLVTIHEWGHFWVARRCGVKVLRFSVGFGKPLWLKKGRDGTEYAIAAIPLGGFVRMLDEREGTVHESEKHLAFNNKPVTQRIAIVAAGPVVNLVFAVLAYWLMFVVGVSTVAPVIGALEVATPVADSRLPVGVEIVSVDGSAVRSWEDVNLRLAARVGESGVVRFGVKSAPASEPINIDVRLDSWKVDLEKETPLNAIGIVPYRPAVKALIGQVVDGGAASKAGLEVNDLVTAANGQVIEDWIDLVHIVQQSANRPVALEIKRGDRQMSLQMVPEGRVVDSGELQGYIGAGVMSPTWPDIMLRTIEYGPIEAIGAAFNKTIHMISLTLDSIWKMIEGVISVKNLSGPITIAKVAGASAASGFEPFISFLAYLSISLGVLNLLPIPVLDGGHLLYYMVELVRGKPVSEKVQEIGFKLGMVVLLSLMTLAIFNDFMRL